MGQQLDQVIKSLGDISNSLNSFDPQTWITAIIGFFTLLLLFCYTRYTGKIAKATEETMIENLRPIVSCELKSGKNCYTKEQLQ